jgi:hypothetical protein
VPVIATANVAGTIAYFEKTLGFLQQWTWGEPPLTRASKLVARCFTLLTIPSSPQLSKERRLTPDVFLWVQDIDSVHERTRSSDAEII